MSKKNKSATKLQMLNKQDAKELIHMLEDNSTPIISSDILFNRIADLLQNESDYKRLSKENRRLEKLCNNLTAVIQNPAFNRRYCAFGNKG